MTFRVFVHAPDRGESGVGGFWAGHAAPSTRRLWTQQPVPTKNSVLIEPVELERSSISFVNAMLATILSRFFSIRQGLRTRAALQAEILALRHQLLVLQRSTRSRKLRLGVADRLVWVWLWQLWRDGRSALLIVKPETVIAWQRRGFRRYGSWKSRHPLRRPTGSREIIDLIGKMSLANPRWGAPGLHGELLKLGFALSEATVAK